VFGLAVAVMVLLWTDRTDQVLSRLIGVGLIGVSVTTLWLIRRVVR
jgi:hypothetical protein